MISKRTKTEKEKGRTTQKTNKQKNKEQGNTQNKINNIKKTHKNQTTHNQQK
jgi:hypothetical protein